MPATAALAEHPTGPEPAFRGEPARVRAAVLTGVGGVLAVGLLHVRDPGEPGSYLSCPFLGLTGLACPGCGGLRAVHALTGGDLALAWELNPLAVVLVPLVVAAWAAWLTAALCRRPAWQPGTAAILGLAVVLVAFWVLRNIPALMPYLGPAAVP